jgi:S-adenosylmethionine hydrolase
MAIVTLLTDYGAADTYVGQMRGALLAVSPELRLVDLTHAVPPQDVRAGAFLLWSAVEVFAGGTVHLAVVDPGVGSKRRSVAVKAARGDLFVGPDNGLLMPALERLGGIAAAVELRETRYWRENPSNTFHGRDIFAPVAAHLATGQAALEDLGPRITDLERPFSFAPPTREGIQLRGEILHIDSYGNLVTNIPAQSLPRHFVVHFRGEEIQPRSHYAAVGNGDVLALVGSSGLLEIAVCNGDASASLDAHRGDTVVAEQRERTEPAD